MFGLDAEERRKRLATGRGRWPDLGARLGRLPQKVISGLPTFGFAQKYAVSAPARDQLAAPSAGGLSGEINAHAGRIDRFSSSCPGLTRGIHGPLPAMRQSEGRVNPAWTINGPGRLYIPPRFNG